VTKKEKLVPAKIEKKDGSRAGGELLPRSREEDHWDRRAKKKKETFSRMPEKEGKASAEEEEPRSLSRSTKENDVPAEEKGES